MTAAEAVPALEVEVPQETANERLKRAFGSWFWGSMIAATALHAATFAFWPELETEDFSFTTTELEAIELPPEITISSATSADLTSRDTGHCDSGD